MSTTSRLAESNLDASQRAFCTDPCRAVRLLAPAGSGKTESLLWRCLALQDGRPDQASQFLILTFTRAARDALRDRLKSVPSFEGLRPCVEITTLNSWGFRWLRRRTAHAKLMTGAQDRYFCMTNLLKPVWETYERIAEVLNDKRRSSRAARQLMDLMDGVKGMGFRHDTHDRVDLFNDHLTWLTQHGMRPLVDGLLRQLRDLEVVRTDKQDGVIWEAHQHYFEFWRAATSHMYRSSILTLEDQKYWTLIELEREVANGQHDAARRYQHILVDEFQDINTLDLNLLKALSRINKCELAIVGDDDQAIYEWRGATPEFILNPDAHLSAGYRSHVLEVNYRSPQNIVTISQRLIQNNKRRVPKSVRAVMTGEARVEVLRMATLEDSVSYVQRAVKEQLAAEPSRTIALISRKRSQIIPYQIVFASDGISFCAAEDLNVLLSTAFEDLKAILLLKAQAAQPLPLGPDPVEGLLKMCDKVKRYQLSKADRSHLKSHLMGSRPRSILQALEALYTYKGPLKGQNVGGQMSASFYQAIKRLLEPTSVATSIRVISEEFDGLQKDYGKSLDDIFYADPPFLYLADFAARYGDDFTKFYMDVESAIATLSQLPAEDEESADPQWRRPLHLMTALRAKGKEFDTVFTLDCNQGIWPSKLAETEEQLEAERRLFYVAITRARGELNLLLNDRMFEEVAVPSQYLAEMGLRPGKLSGSV